MSRSEAGGKRTYDLEPRLLAYAAAVIRFVERMEKTRAAFHVADQLVRAAMSVFFNHGEAEAAESRKDFVHKFGICLKELKECHRAFQLVREVPLVKPDTEVDPLLRETDELIRIFAASIRTAKSNMVHEPQADAYTGLPGDVDASGLSSFRV